MSAELARKALEAAPDATVIIDDAGLVRFSNRQTTVMFGHEPHEIVGQSIEKLLPERLRGRHVNHRRAFFDNVRVRPMGAGLDLFALRKDGSEFPVEISLSPLEDDERTLVAASIRDITDRKRIEAQLRHLQSITDTALSSGSTETLIRALLARLRAALHSDTTTILLTDADGRYLIPVASDGLEAEVAGEVKVPIGQGVAGRIALSDGPVILEDLRQIEIVSPILRSRVQSVVGTPLRSAGQLIGVVHAGSATFRRFTPAEAHLLSLAADRMGIAIERTRLHELEQAARRAAEAANQAKSRFLATASHDLRQPLQTLALLNGTLRRTSLDSVAEEVLEQQEQAIDAMSRLLNALLDISKLESGAIKPDPSDFVVNEIFEELRREFAGLASNKGLDLRVEACLDCVHSDRSLVGQILRNLLANAIKYTRSGWVALRCLHESALVRLEVVDSGVGIPADQLGYIYDEFYQIGVPASSSREGYGLGLSIVKRAAALLGARLDAQSEVGKGSTFALTLPAGSRAADISRPAEAGRTEQPVPESARILLVEDDPGVRNATRMLLKSEGFQVVAAVSMEDALKHAIEDPRIDLLMTDYHLQDGKTGTQVIAAVRAALHRQLKAVLVTGDTSSAIAALPIDPLTRIVRKPINADELLAHLRALLAAQHVD